MTRSSGYADDQLVDFFVRASAFFGEQLREVDDESWERPTPCAGWDIRTVVAHVVVGDAQIPVLFGGSSVERVEEFDASVLGANPMAAWRGTALAAVAAFSQPGALEQRYSHPVGQVRGRTVAGFRISDSLVHGWDIATAMGRPVQLDAELCEYCLDFWFPMAASLPDSGHYAPALLPREGAGADERLLALLGRAA